MADVYRGLTIRIGADTQPLTRALSTVNSALSRVQSSMRLVQKGLKLDPANLTATQQGIGLVSERTELLSQKLIQLRNSFDQAKQKTPWLTNAATGMEHLAANTEQATSVFNRINQELEEFKNVYNKMASDNGLKVSDDFRTTLWTLENAGHIQHDVIVNYDRMAAAQVKWNDQLNRMQKAEQFRRMAQEMEQLKAEIKAAAQEYANLFAKSSAEHIIGADGNEIVRSKAALESLSGIQSQILTHAEKLKEAWQLDPSDAQMASAVMREFGENTAVAEQKLAEAKRYLSELDNAGIKDSALSFEKLSTEAESAKGKLAEAKAAEDGFNAELKETERQLAIIEALADKKDHSDEIYNLKKRIGELNVEIEKASGETKEWEGKVEGLYQQLEKKKAQRAVEELTADVKKAKHAQDEVNESVRRTRFNYAALRDLGTTFANTISPLATAALYRTVTAADDLDSAYRDMRKTVDGTEEQFEDLKRAAIEFSQTSVVSAADILEIEAMGGQLGIAVENLETFAEVASNLDIATDIESEEIAKSMGQLSNIMHWNQDIVDGTRSDYEKFSDSLVRLGNNLPAQESAIMDITNRIAPMGTLLDMSTDQVLAWSAALASTGQGSEAAGTALSKTMSQIETAVAKGGDSLDGFAKVAGMSSDEFAKLWKSDSSSALQRFVEGLHRIDEAGGSVDKTLGDLKINGVRQKQALEGLANTTDILSDALDMSAAAWTLGGDAAEEARKKSEGFSGTYHMLLNNGKALAAALGEGLVPFLKVGIELASQFASWLGNMSQVGKSTIAMFIGLAAASGPVFRLWGQTQVFLDAQARNMQRTGKEAGKLSKKWSSLSKSMKAGVAIGAALAAVLAITLYDAISKAIKHQRDYRKATDGLLDTVGLGPKTLRKYGDSFGYVSKKIKRVDIDKLTEDAAELTDTIAGRRREAGMQIALLEDYRETISRLGKDGSIATEDVAEFRIAVDGLNGILGTDYQVSGNAADGYYLMADGAVAAKEKIYELIDAMQTKISLTAYEEDLVDMKKQAKEQSDKMQEAAEGYAYWMKKANEVGEGDERYQDYVKKASEFAEDMADAEAELNATNEAMSQTERQAAIVSAAMDESAGSFERFLATNDLVNGMLASNGFEEAGSFAKSLKDLGISQSEFADLTPTQMALVAGAYDGTTASIERFVEDGGFKAEEDFVGVWEEAATDVPEAVKGIPDAMAKGFAKAMAGNESAFKAGADKMKSSILNNLSVLGPYGADAGRNLLLGLANGVHDNAIIARITDHIKSIASKVLQSFMDGLVEKSPSKATEQMGAYLLEGLAIGIDENAQLAYKAAQNASDLALAGFGAITAGEMAVNANNASSMVLNVSFNGVTINDNAAIESQTLELVMALQQLWRTKAGA